MARPLNRIAQDISDAWPGANARARDAIETLGRMTGLSDVVDGWKTGKGTVEYFLANAKGWRGEGARKIKTELRSLLAALAVELDEDPGAALDVIMGRHRGSRVYALICLADAMRHGDYPQGWEPRR